MLLSWEFYKQFKFPPFVNVKLAIKSKTKIKVSQKFQQFLMMAATSQTIPQEMIFKLKNLKFFKSNTQFIFWNRILKPFSTASFHLARPNPRYILGSIFMGKISRNYNYDKVEVVGGKGFWGPILTFSRRKNYFDQIFSLWRQKLHK